MISSITSTQVYKQIHPIVKKNMTHLFIYRLRNYGDLEAIVEEMSAIHDKKILLQMHSEAISEPYSLLYINLMQRDKSKLFSTGLTITYCQLKICFIIIYIYKDYTYQQ